MTATRTVLVLTSDPGGPVVRHRFALFAGALRARGIELDVAPWPKAGGVRRKTLARCSDAGAVVVSSRLLARGDVERVRRAATRLGFDFDDALPFRDSTRGATLSRTRVRRFQAIVRAADRVTAGNTYLVALAREAGRVATTTPTVVPVPDRMPAGTTEDGPGVLGWIGSRVTIPYLESCAEALAGVAARGLPFRVRSIADAGPRFPSPIETEHVAWTPDGWEAALAGIDVGLAPLPDDRWTRGKCGLKLLQTYAVGRPVVASAVGVQNELVVDGETGFLADDTAAFTEGLVTLLEDPERRRNMGCFALEHVRAQWSVAAWAPHVVGEMEALLGGERSADVA